MKQLQSSLFLDTFNNKVKKSQASTFINNMKLPIHRWFRFSAGFSAQWVIEVIREEVSKKGDQINVLDPFVGSGTALLCADLCGVRSYGIESQPFIAKIARIKTHWNCDIRKFKSMAYKVLDKAKDHLKIQDEYPKLIYKCFSENALLKCEGLKKAWKNIDDGTIESNLVWFCITCILRPASTGGTAPWQYILPKKIKKKVLEVFEAFDWQIKIMIEDISLYQRFAKPISTLIFASSMDSEVIPDNIIDFVITSPPYANNYDYADFTRFEMSFWREIKGWGDLQEKVRKNLLRSCSQHASLVKQSLDEILADPNLEPILPEIKKVTKKLEKERENYGGRKHYHLMVAGYFSDMAKVWNNLRRMCRTGSKLCFVVGDSAPYSVYVPVDNWIGEIALASGFHSYCFDKIRDRNVKWKNRKHKVPLHEGNLWVKG